ncbi:MAG: DUF4129 domain-containing protein [Dehalococcoidia bacterium]|nr:DUF4129 domain-containing protein [Dehalococcoidia bacterium]
MRRKLQSMALPALQLGMQSCWLYAWLYVLEMRLLQRHVITPAVLLFAAVALTAHIYIQRSPLKRALKTVCFWLLWVVCAAVAGKLLLFPSLAWGQLYWTYALPHALIRLLWVTPAAELLLLLGSCGAWYVGGRAADRKVTYETLLAQFQFGLVMLFAAFLLAQALGVSTTHPILLSVVFFTLSLTAIAITRNRQGNEAVSPPGGRHFTGSLATLLVAVSVLGLLAGIAITPDLVGLIVDGVRFIGRTLVAALVFLLSLLPAPDIPSGGELAPPATGDDSGLTEFYRTLPWPAILRRILYIGWVITILGMALFALWRICSMVLEWLKRRGDASGVEIESLDSGLLADLLALIVWVQRKLRHAVNRLTSFVLSRIGAAGEPTWSSVYQGLTHWTSRKVLPRETWQSAHEYQSALSMRMPVAAGDLAFVTATYAEARYGGREPDRTTIQEMQHAVSRIRKAPRPRRIPTETTQTEGEE